jgi:hypothetical protein
MNNNQSGMLSEQPKKLEKGGRAGLSARQGRAQNQKLTTDN